jgi:hypothetical protein
LATPDGKVRGKHDVALLTSEGVVIRDHKTGRVYDPDEETDSWALKSEYVLQLKLYAALYARARGVWPIRLEVVTLQDEVIGVPFTPGECEALFDQAVGTLDEVARQVQEVNDGKMQLTALANPTEQTCRLCPYRPICPAHRAESESRAETPPGRTADLWGTSVEIRKGRRGLVVLDLETVLGQRHIGDLDGSPRRNPALALLAPGDEVAVFNDVRHTTPDSFLAGDFTVVYKLLPEGRLSR